MMRTIKPVLLMASPNCLVRLMMRALLSVSRLENEYDDEDDDQDESSDADAHDFLLPWSMMTFSDRWARSGRATPLGRRATPSGSVRSTGIAANASDVEAAVTPARCMLGSVGGAARWELRPTREPARIPARETRSWCGGKASAAACSTSTACGDLGTTSEGSIDLLVEKNAMARSYLSTA